MSETFPPPHIGSDDSKERIRQIILERGLTGAANDNKWSKLLNAMRQRQGWTPSYRYKCVDGSVPSNWDVEWWYHLPLPMMSVEWFDIGYFQEIHRGMLLDPEMVNHSDWIIKILSDARFSYDVFNDFIRIYGYLPKSFDYID